MKGIETRNSISFLFFHYFGSFPAQRWDERDWDSTSLRSDRTRAGQSFPAQRWDERDWDKNTFLRIIPSEEEFPAQRWDERDWDKTGCSDDQHWQQKSSLLRDEMKGIETIPPPMSKVKKLIIKVPCSEMRWKGLRLDTSGRSSRSSGTLFPAQRWDERDWDPMEHRCIRRTSTKGSLLRDEMKGIETNHYCKNQNYPFHCSLLRDEMKGIETNSDSSADSSRTPSSLLRDEMKGIETGLLLSLRAILLPKVPCSEMRWKGLRQIPVRQSLIRF